MLLMPICFWVFSCSFDTRTFKTWMNFKNMAKELLSKNWNGKLHLHISFILYLDTWVWNFNTFFSSYIFRRSEYHFQNNLLTNFLFLLDKFYFFMFRKRFEIGKTIGNGKFGIVSKGKLSNKEVAIKTNLHAHNKSQLAALISEKSILEELPTHKNLVQFYGSCEEKLTDGQAWLILEYCIKGDLLVKKRIH